jgi:hypothetical protein
MSAADQTISVLDSKGGGVIVDGTSASFTGVSALTVKKQLSIIGASPLALSDAASGGLCTFAFDPGAFHSYEIVLKTAKDHSNVLALQNTGSGANNYSAATFRGSDGIERGAVGYGNASCDLPFQSSTFLEASYFTGAAHTTPPPKLLLVQTGYVGGAYGTYPRMMFASDGTMQTYLPDGATPAWKQLANGWTKFAGAVPGDNAFTVRNSAADGYSSVQINDENDAKAGVFGHGNSATASWTTGCLCITANARPLLLAIGASEKIRIHSDGRVGIQVLAPTAWLHIKAGAAGASSAPIKIDAGVVLTTPEPGAIESDGTHLYWTTAAGARKQLDNTV